MSKFRLASGPLADTEAYCPSPAQIRRVAAKLRAQRPAAAYTPEPSTPRILEREIRMNEIVGKERYQE